MPIYEFYCPDCHVIFSFLSRTANPSNRPACPRCARPELDRQPSVFATPCRDMGEDGPGPGPAQDEARLHRALQALAAHGQVDESDPRQAARLMRAMTESLGLAPGSGLAEALRRLESGEDPESVEADLGSVLDGEDPFIAGSGPRQATRRLPPERDDILHDL